MKGSVSLFMAFSYLSWLDTEIFLEYIGERVGWALTPLLIFLLLSLDLAIGRLKEQEASNKRPSENLKVLLVLVFG